MALLLRELAKGYNHVFFELADARYAGWPLLGSPLPLLGLLGAYLFLAPNLGPRLMQNRPAFRLDRLIQAYNVMQIALSVYLVERALTLAWLNKYRWVCEPVDYSMDPAAFELGRSCYIYFLVKVFDLLDTVFIVLRKKTAQLSFLHVYHHGGMIVAAWVCAKYLPGGHGSFVGLLNCFVHAVMYSYYLVTSLYPQHKNNMWWKKHITQLQMVQFLAINVMMVLAIAQPVCAYPKVILLLILPQNTFMLFMFYDFYRKAYRSHPKAA